MLSRPDIIARSQTDDLTYLVSEYGKTFTAAGFGNWFRERCNEVRCRLQHPRAPQGPRDHGCGEWCNRSTVHGTVRLDVGEAAPAVCFR